MNDTHYSKYCPNLFGKCTIYSIKTKISAYKRAGCPKRLQVEKDPAANKGKNINVIVNFGVNDIGNVGEYIEYRNSFAEDAGKDVSLYYMSVNTVKGCKTVTNEQTQKFNEELKEGLCGAIT